MIDILAESERQAGRNNTVVRHLIPSNEMQQSTGHVEFIDGYEYYKIDERLFRAEIANPLVDGRRRGQFVTLGTGVEIPLRMARVAAGQQE